MNRVDLPGAWRRVLRHKALAEKAREMAVLSARNLSSASASLSWDKEKRKHETIADYWRSQVSKLTAQNKMKSLLWMEPGIIGAFKGSTYGDPEVTKLACDLKREREIITNIRRGERSIEERKHYMDRLAQKAYSAWDNSAVNLSKFYLRGKRRYYNTENYRMLSSIFGQSVCVSMMSARNLYEGLIREHMPLDITNGGSFWTMLQAKTVMSQRNNHYMGEFPPSGNYTGKPEHNIPCVPADFYNLMDKYGRKTMQDMCPFPGCAMMVIPQYENDGILISKVFGLAIIKSRVYGVNERTVEKFSINEGKPIYPVSVSSEMRRGGAAYCEWWAASSTHLRDVIVTGAVDQKTAIETTRTKIAEYVSNNL